MRRVCPADAYDAIVRIDSRTRHRLSALVLALGLAYAALAAPALQGLPDEPHLQRLREYIKTSWTTLTRSNRDLPRALPDPKMPRKPGEPWLLYLAPQESRARVQTELTSALGADGMKQIEIRVLPRDVLSIREHGLLYLPHPYVVPGGRFNEMYGWDSYFIQVGLLRDGEDQRARDMVENFLYEIDHYGTILNANRTYYLSRSQPPFLTQMILGVYAKSHDKQWLASTLPSIEKFHRFWTTGAHRAGDTGLSRYWDFGEGPGAEVVSAEKDAQGRNHYDLVREYYRTHDVKDYDVSLYYDRQNDKLRPLFFKGDRSMRESGFDPSDRFGPFSIDIIHHAPVCLNS